jgi:hypothetical protein
MTKPTKYLIMVVLLAAPLSSAFNAVVWAQTIPAVTINAAGGCPTQEELRRANINPDDGSATALIGRMATAVRTGVLLYRTSALSNPTIQNISLGFDDDVEVLAGSPAGQRGPALVKRIKDPICGWLNAADLERFSQPYSLTQIPGFEKETDRLGSKNRLEARVVVKNRVDRQTGYGLRAPLFDAPFAGDEPPEDQRRGSIGFFEVLSVYDVRRADGTRCRVFRDADCFLRVGSSTTLGAGNTGIIRTRGWMRGTDVEIWPSALAVYYNSGKQGLKIHQSEPSARVGTQWRTPGVRESILAFQPEGRFEEPRERDIVRFPVIRGTPFLSDPASQKGTTLPRSETLSYVYEIVFNGQACVEDSRDGRSGCIPEPQIKDEIARLGQVVRAISNIDVLFVIDATESMGPYLQAVVAAIRRHVTEAQTRNEWSLRYSIVLYGDYNRKKEGGLDYYSLAFSPVNDLEPLNRLQSIGTFDDENKDKPEAPFAALERAANSAQWRPDAAQRLIVWIADHGNRPSGTYTTAAGTLVETKTARSVTDAIQGADKRLLSSGATAGAAHTRFVALQVQGGVTASSQADFQRFRQNADEINGILGEKVYKTIAAGAKQNLNQELETLSTSIARQITNNVEAFVDARQTVVGALQGDKSRLQANLTSSSSLLARDFLAQLGFPAERLLEIGQRIQLVRNGFVFQGGQNPDYRYWLGLRRPEFTDVRAKARDLCENLRFTDRWITVEGAMLALVRAVTFSDMRSDETIGSFYSRVFSVPASAISPTLRERTPADFLRSWTSLTPAEQEEKIGSVCKKAALLDYIGNGQFVEERDLVFDKSRNNNVVLRPGAVPKLFDWRWITSDARTEWYFIPMDGLP